ncbi:hypothetical protein QOZ95_005237 [Paenibacillus brasilensis]|uniref:Uncharacterized protein n=1 Tax=Paenibacillus brasilensis TaxID=128574 RepID=A0ABU0L6V9_9BACL|nr:hypothetical protein [Paenibacillus brasilensis]MDQ0497037.1 hypothetical protein [Paenibacillus brasilensis]
MVEKKSITILQSILTPEEVQSVAKETDYEDKARKFTVTHLLQYWCAAALEQWDSYRSGVDHAAHSGLPVVHYSCFSTKAAEVPFAIFKELFDRVIHKCSRETRRKLTFPNEYSSSTRPP